MKNPIRSLALIVLSLLFTVAVAGAESYNGNIDAAASDGSIVVAKLPAKKVKVTIAEKQSSSPSSGFWWSAYSGTDLAVLGDISNQVQSDKQLALLEAGAANASSDHIGLLVGTELGYDLDKDDSLSLSFEKVWTSNQTANASEGLGFFHDRYEPSLLGVSLSYARVVDSRPGSKLSFSLGMGFYHADMKYDSNFFGPEEVVGNFGGDILGGTLGIKEELSIAGDLGLELTARGRVANFSQLVSKSLSVNGVDQTGGPFTLVKFSEPFSEVIPVETSGSLPPGINHLQLDYSGFDGNVALVWHI